MKDSDVQKAERYGHQRANLLPVLAIIVIVQQGLFMANGAGDSRDAITVAIVWTAMALLMILLAATGGGFLMGRKVRQMMNDEASDHVRRKANSLGLINGMLTAVILYGLTFVKDFTAREAIVVIFAVAISSALLSFGIWERQALRDG